MFTPLPFDRRYSADWALLKEEEERALRDKRDKEAKEQEAEALQNYQIGRRVPGRADSARRAIHIETVAAPRA